MKEIYEEPSSYDEKYFVEKYGQKSYSDFSRFALGKTGLARTDEGRLILTGKGLELYFNLLSDEKKSRIQELMILSSSFVAAGTLVMGTGTILEFSLNESLGMMRFAYALGLVFLFGVSLLGVHKYFSNVPPSR